MQKKKKKKAIKTRHASIDLRQRVGGRRVDLDYSTEPTRLQRGFGTRHQRKKRWKTRERRRRRNVEGRGCLPGGGRGEGGREGEGRSGDLW